MNPEKIILFGSHAKGGWVEDILVVTKDNPEKTYTQEAKIMDRVDRYKPPVNLEIHEIVFIEAERKAKPNSISIHGFRRHIFS